MTLNDRQKKLLLQLYNYKFGEIQIAGYGRAPWLSTANALVRRGLADSWRTGHFGITEEGRKFIEKEARP